MDVKIYSEVSPLRCVITHQPGQEHEYITPSNLTETINLGNKTKENPNYLLFDDIIYVQKAITEHKALYDILHCFTNGNCYEFTELLSEVLKDNNTKNNLIDECINLDKTLYDNIISKETLVKLDNKSLINTLLSGYCGTEKLFKHPIPNLIFTRDIAVCIGKTILITWSKKHVRQRENILAKYLFSHYKLFNSLHIFDFHLNYPNLTIEGGDIIVFNKDIICIGISERTPLESVKRLTPLFYKEGFKKVIAIDLPKKRALMHLDTIFTRISEDEVLIFPPILEQDFDKHFNKSFIFEKNSNTPKEKNKNLINLLNENNLNIKYIKCGSDSSIMQQREQWTDGANAFALSAGKIIGYDCNKYTIKELVKSGYKVLSSDEYINNYSKYNKSADKVIITIKGSELSRGRGGPRCLTLPIFRT